MSISNSISGQRACPACQHVGAVGRRFCGQCCAVLVRPCSGCGFGNELDDAWCGGCARALAPRTEGPAATEAPTPVLPRARAGAVVPATPDTLPALLLAINRGGATAAVVDDVHDQDALDALFGAQP